MALNSGKILMRRGQEVNFDPNKMMPGEWAVSLDSKFVRMCFSPGVCVRMATYDAFEADMAQIQRILSECQTIEEAVERIYSELKNVVVDVEKVEESARNAMQSEQNALNSANSASQSANTAVNKANEAFESANTASAKAEQATEGARIATEKANEASESAENVRNIYDVSKSYAVGGTGTREGENTDNAKYYNQQASDNADRAEAAAERASAVTDIGVATSEKVGLVKPDGTTVTVDPDGTIHAIGGGGGSSGTMNYDNLENKPSINGIELSGNNDLSSLGIQPAGNYLTEETDPTVPQWAKSENKPTYTASEVGADVEGSADTAYENAKKYTDDKFEGLKDVNDATLSIQKNGTTIGTFTANSSTDKTVNIIVPTKISELNNDSGFISSATTLDTLEEIEANTESGKFAGALAVKELNNKFGGLRFGKDGEGNYGYFGADGSLIPFSVGGGFLKENQMLKNGVISDIVDNNLTIERDYLNTHVYFVPNKNIRNIKTTMSNMNVIIVVWYEDGTSNYKRNSTSYTFTADNKIKLAAAYIDTGTDNRVATITLS